METHELLFELSHPVRYEITKLLAERPLRLTKIGDRVDANNPEVSRHLDRLKNADLVAKNVDGYYSTTSFGRIIMGLLPAISFVAAHPDFFVEHDLSHLPPEFMSRLGELEPCDVLEGTTVNIYHLDEISKNATERIFTVSNEFITKVKDEDLAGLGEAISSGFTLRYILQESQLNDANLMHLVDNCPAENDCFRVVPHVPLFATMCDDTMMITFLDGKGKADFSFGFISSDPKVCRWCEDLLNHLWAIGKPPSAFH
jgi:predicted transcriptional regulator